MPTHDELLSARDAAKIADYVKAWRAAERAIEDDRLPGTRAQRADEAVSRCYRLAYLVENTGSFYDWSQTRDDA